MSTGLNIQATTFRNSKSGAGLTCTISKAPYLRKTPTERTTFLKEALGRRYTGSRDSEAVNFAISYESMRVTPKSTEGLKQLDKMLSQIFRDYGNIEAFRLWFDKIYASDGKEPHMTRQQWVQHGLTPYAFCVVLVLGGESVAHNSSRGWVRSELGAGHLHCGYSYVKDGGTFFTAGMGKRWNSSEGRKIASDIVQGLGRTLNPLKCYNNADTNSLKALMEERCGGGVS